MYDNMGPNIDSPTTMLKHNVSKQSGQHIISPTEVPSKAAIFVALKFTFDAAYIIQMTK